MKNTVESYTAVWLALDKAYEKLTREQRRYCINNLVRELYRTDAEIPRKADGSVRPRYLFNWQLCWELQKGGFEQLTPPLHCKSKSRDLVHALSMLSMNTSPRGASLRLIDQGYKEAKRIAALRGLDEIEALLG